jgi:hypothetical protein
VQRLLRAQLDTHEQQSSDVRTQQSTAARASPRLAIPNVDVESSTRVLNEFGEYLCAMRSHSLFADIKALFNEHCAICLEPYEVGARVITMHCDHFYHEDCIISWLKVSSRVFVSSTNRPPHSER